MSIELKAENCLYMDCGGCVNDESTRKEKQFCSDGIICAKFVNDEYIHMSNLGENARKMLEIGRLQDELVKLGFKELLISHYINEDKDISVYFFKKHAYIGGNDVYDYTSPTWQQDVLNKVKELINANQI